MSILPYISRIIDAKYCEGCGVKNGIYLMSLDKPEYSCPRCQKLMKNQTTITIRK